MRFGLFVVVVVVVGLSLFDDDALPSSVVESGSTSTSQILAVWSALHVASFFTSGDRRIRVMYSLWAENCVTGRSWVRS